MIKERRAFVCSCVLVWLGLVVIVRLISCVVGNGSLQESNSTVPSTFVLCVGWYKYKSALDRKARKK